MANAQAQPSTSPDPTPSPDMSGASWDSIIGAAVKGLKSDDEIISQLKDSAKAARDVAQQMASIKLPDPPPVPELPPPPQPQFHSPMQEFGSLASTLGVFASLLTRHPLTSALNASAAAMNSIHQGDLQGYRAAMDTWQSQSDYAIKVADMQNQRYQQILDNTKYSVDQKMNLINADAAANNDLVLASKMRTEGIDGVANLLMNRARLQIALAKSAGGVTGKWSPQNEAYLGLIDEKTAALGHPPSPQEAAQIRVDAYKELQGSKSSSPIDQVFQAQVDAFRAKNGRDPNAQELTDIYKYVAQQSPSGQKTSAATTQLKGDIKTASDLTRQAIQNTAQTPSSVGAAGVLARPLQGVRGWFTGQGSPAKEFAGQITQIQNIIKKLTQSGQMTEAQTSRLDDIVRGLGLTDNPSDARRSLEDILRTLTEIGGGYYVEPGTTDGEYVAPYGGDANDPATWIKRQ